MNPPFLAVIAVGINAVDRIARKEGGIISGFHVGVSMRVSVGIMLLVQLSRQ